MSTATLESVSGTRPQGQVPAVDNPTDVARDDPTTKRRKAREPEEDRPNAELTQCREAVREDPEAVARQEWLARTWEGWSTEDADAEAEGTTAFWLGGGSSTLEGIKGREASEAGEDTGIGRTGCFIATSICCKQLKNEGVVDILRTTSQLRLDRGGMIQTSEQYQFVHHVMSLYEKQYSRATSEE
ncbi:UNVERIFIED_CONTAM: hypothetical protein K2H54_060189 [Gekko kuhli]